MEVYSNNTLNEKIEEIKELDDLLEQIEKNIHFIERSITEDSYNEYESKCNSLDEEYEIRCKYERNKMERKKDNNRLKFLPYIGKRIDAKIDEVYSNNMNCLSIEYSNKKQSLGDFWVPKVEQEQNRKQATEDAIGILTNLQHTLNKKKEKLISDVYTNPSKEIIDMRRKQKRKVL